MTVHVPLENWKTSNGYVVYRMLSGINNAYLISSPTHNILVDTGAVSDYGQLMRNIDTICLLNGTIDLMVLTHIHYDHCQNAKTLKDIFNCKIIASHRAQGTIDKGSSSFPRSKTLFRSFLMLTEKIRGERHFGFPSFEVDIYVEDHFCLTDHGINVHILESAGHSEDSVSIIVDDEIAMVGDLMFGIFRNSVLPFLYDDKDEVMRSWKKLLETKCKLFLPGHGKAIERERLELEVASRTA